MSINMDNKRKALQTEIFYSWDGGFIVHTIILLQPAAIEDLRRWTSTEALGDVTVPPDCASRILGDTTGDDAVDHKLPSPEEQVQAIALK